MAAILKKVAKIIAEGLAYAARTTALREGLPWDADSHRPRSGPRTRT